MRRCGLTVLSPHQRLHRPHLVTLDKVLINSAALKYLTTLWFTSVTLYSVTSPHCSISLLTDSTERSIHFIFVVLIPTVGAAAAYISSYLLFSHVNEWERFLMEEKLNLSECLRVLRMCSFLHCCRS